jgi:hypothetical protein
MACGDWSMLTALPRRIIGSLGPTKADLATLSNHTFFCSAAELNLIRNCIGWLMEAVGLPSGYAPDSIQGRLDTLEADRAAGRFRHLDPFIMGEESTAPPLAQYAVENVDVPSDGDEAGGLIALTFGAGTKSLQDWRYPFRRRHSLMIEVRVKLTSVSEDSDVRFGFMDAANNNGFAWCFIPAFSSAWVLVGVSGGAPAFLPVGDPIVAGDWYTLRLRCTSTGDVYGSINGGAETMLTPFVLPDAALKRLILVTAGSEPNEEARFDYWLTEATFLE